MQLCAEKVAIMRMTHSIMRMTHLCLPCGCIYIEICVYKYTHLANIHHSLCSIASIYMLLHQSSRVNACVYTQRNRSDTFNTHGMYKLSRCISIYRVCSRARICLRYIFNSKATQRTFVFER